MPRAKESKLSTAAAAEAPATWALWCAKGDTASDDPIDVDMTAELAPAYLFRKVVAKGTFATGLCIRLEMHFKKEHGEWFEVTTKGDPGTTEFTMTVHGGDTGALLAAVQANGGAEGWSYDPATRRLRHALLENPYIPAKKYPRGAVVPGPPHIRKNAVLRGPMGFLPWYSTKVLVAAVAQALCLTNPQGGTWEVQSKPVVGLEADSYTVGKHRDTPNQDAVLVHPRDKDTGLAIFGVFDGHGSAAVAHLARDRAPVLILDQFRAHLAPNEVSAAARGKAIVAALRGTMAALDRACWDEWESLNKTMDYREYAAGAGPGSCVLLAVVDCIAGTYAVANVGDCRAYRCLDLGMRFCPLAVLTEEHNGTLASEQARIMMLGGFVAADDRVGGNLLPSRVVGDVHVRVLDPAVNRSLAPVPYIHWAPIDTACGLVLISDGLEVPPTPDGQLYGMVIPPGEGHYGPMHRSADEFVQHFASSNRDDRAALIVRFT